MDVTVKFKIHHTLLHYSKQNKQKQTNTNELRHQLLAPSCKQRHGSRLLLVVRVLLLSLSSLLSFMMLLLLWFFAAPCLERALPQQQLSQPLRHQWWLLIVVVGCLLLVVVVLTHTGQTSRSLNSNLRVAFEQTNTS
jgi:hypothetical protein